MLKQGVFDKFSDAASRIRKEPKSRKTSSKDSLFGSDPIIDADFVEVDEDLSLGSGQLSSKINPESIDPQTLKNLKKYLKTRSDEEVSQIFEEIYKILEGRGFKAKFSGNGEAGTSYSERTDRNEPGGNAFRNFSKTISSGKERLIRASKIASSRASYLASEGKESIIISSQKLNEKWNNLSPKERKMISEILIAMIEIGILKGSSKSRKAAFAILSSIYRRQTPGKIDMEDFVEGLQKVFKRLR